MSIGFFNELVGDDRSIGSPLSKDYTAELNSNPLSTSSLLTSVNKKTGGREIFKAQRIVPAHGEFFSHFQKILPVH